MMDNEQVLLRRYVQSRDAVAFRELVDEHKGMVFAACRRVLGNRADAEDAAQECFLKFSLAAGRLKAPIGGWLHTVAVRTAIDILRGETARKAREHSAARHDVVTEEARWEDVEGEVDAAIESLPKRLRTPIVLYFLEGRTQEETGIALGLTRWSVARRLDRGIEVLRRRLKRAGIVAPAVALTAMLTANAAEAAPVALTATLGKVALAGAGGTKVAAATGGTLVTLKTAAVLVVAAGVGAGALAVHHAAKAPHPAPMAAATPAPPAAERAPQAEEKSPQALLTPEIVLNAELTLTSTVLHLSELRELVNDQIGVKVVYRDYGKLPYLPVLERGRHKVRDVLAVIDKSPSLTTEVVVDRDRVVICIWRKPETQMLAEMMELAVSDDVVERCTGARWLEMVGGRDALVQLVKMLADPEPRVRYFAAKAVARGWIAFRPGAPSALSCVAPEGIGLVAANAMEAEAWRATQEYLLKIVGDLRDPSALPVLERLLGKQAKMAAAKDPLTTYRICRAIADIGGPKAEAILLAAMDQLPEQHTDDAIYALGRLGTDTAIVRLGKQVDTMVNQAVRRHLRALTFALAHSGNPAAVQVLKRIISLRMLNERETADLVMEDMRRFDTPEAQALRLAQFRAVTDPARRRDMLEFMLDIPTVREELFAELAQGGIVARKAALALSSTNDPRLVPTLIKILEIDEATLRVEGTARMEEETDLILDLPGCRGDVVYTLICIGTPEAEKAVVGLAMSEDPLRNEVLWYLGSSTSPDVRKMLRAALNHEDPNRRGEAGAALSQHRDPADINHLLASLRMVGVEFPEGQWRQAAQATWTCVSGIGGEQAARELVAEAARGDAALFQHLERATGWSGDDISGYFAASSLVGSQDAHCVKAVRDALTGDDANLRGVLMAAFNGGERLSAHYAVDLALAELPGADEQLKMKRAKLFGWVRDPRGIDALGKLLVNAEESVAVRRAAAKGIAEVRDADRRAVARGLLRRYPWCPEMADPGAVSPLRHALEHDPDLAVKKLAKDALMRWGVIPFDMLENPDHPGGEREFVPNPLPDQ